MARISEAEEIGVTFHFSNGNEPILITAKDSNRTALIMPMNYGMLYKGE